VGQFDDAVLSIGASRRGPLQRKVTVDLAELGHEERIDPVNDLRIQIRKWSTADHWCSVRENRFVGASSIVSPRHGLSQGKF
jgi:hypothetical protein